jgi:hypothetical protein
MHVDNPKTALLQHPALQHNTTAAVCYVYAGCNCLCHDH